MNPFNCSLCFLLLDEDGTLRNELQVRAAVMAKTSRRRFLMALDAIGEQEHREEVKRKRAKHPWIYNKRTRPIELVIEQYMRRRIVKRVMRKGAKKDAMREKSSL